MVPEALPLTAVKVGGSVRVSEVTGGRESVGQRAFGPPIEMVNNDQFRQALVLALDNSGLFSEVSKDRGDLDLYATINSEDERSGIQDTATMVVSYKFVDRASDVVWSASYDSEFSSTNYAPAIRTRNAREGCVRENLSALIQGIIKTWPKK
jgi:hypothetical protein